MSTCRRARSSEASSCWFGDVEVWVDEIAGSDGFVLGQTVAL